MPLLPIVAVRNALLNSDDTLNRMRQLLPKLRARYLSEGGRIIPDQLAATLDFLQAEQVPDAG